MVSFEIFVKAMPPSLSELKVLPSFCFAFKIPDDVTASIVYIPSALGNWSSEDLDIGLWHHYEKIQNSSSIMLFWLQFKNRWRYYFKVQMQVRTYHVWKISIIVLEKTAGVPKFWSSCFGSAALYWRPHHSTQRCPRYLHGRLFDRPDRYST